MEEILIRRDFSDIDVVNTPYILYEKYDELPSYRDYKYGERRSIVLRNVSTGKLEKITYTLCGGVPQLIDTKSYIRYWGEIEAQGAYCCLCFNFDHEGNCYKIHASFCGRSPSPEEFMEKTKNCTYGAASTSIEW